MNPFLEYITIHPVWSLVIWTIVGFFLLLAFAKPLEGCQPAMAALIIISGPVYWVIVFFAMGFVYRQRRRLKAMRDQQVREEAHHLVKEKFGHHGPARIPDEHQHDENYE